VPEREEDPVYCWILKPALPFPYARLPHRTDAHDVLLLAVHVQPGGEVTLIVRVPPACTTVGVVGETSKVQLAGGTGRPMPRRRLTSTSHGLSSRGALRGNSNSRIGSQLSEEESGRDEVNV
jgi:hypothetical protein